MLFSIFIHNAVWMLMSCPHQHLLHARVSRFTHSRVPISIPWMYSSLLWTTETVQHTSTKYISTYSDLIFSVIRRPCETQVNNGERPGISTARLFLPHDQIMTFDWMWTDTWLFMRGEMLCSITSFIWNITCNLNSLYFTELYFDGFGGKEPDENMLLFIEI